MKNGNTTSVIQAGVITVHSLSLTPQTLGPENCLGIQSRDFGQMQMNPIVIDTLLYGVSAALRAFALDARTGEEVWVFGDSIKTWHSASRGVSYWESKEDKRIFYTIGSDLWALNALTGKPVLSFGKKERLTVAVFSIRGKVCDLKYPGTIFRNLIIMPLRLSEGGAAPRFNGI